MNVREKYLTTIEARMTGYQSTIKEITTKSKLMLI